MLIKTFVMCFYKGQRHFEQVDEKAFNRHAQRKPHPDNAEIFAVQVRTDTALSLKALVIAMPEKDPLMAYKPSRHAYKGHFFTMGESLAKKRTGEENLDAFLTYIREECLAPA